MTYTTRTNIGQRANNEDHAYTPSNAGALAFVALSDGMGGHAAGEVASKLAVSSTLEALPEKTAAEPASLLRRAVAQANLSVYRAAHDDIALHGMGATLVCAILKKDRFVAANVGDSRLYHFNSVALKQITTDHSFVELLTQAGTITREEARTHPKRNIITRAIGSGLSVEVDIFAEKWAENDLLLLCSDGLTDNVDDRTICEILKTNETLDILAERLIGCALDSGANDNITVVLVRNDGGERS